MNTWVAVGAVIGAVATVGIAAFERASPPAYAKVVRVTPLIGAVETPRPGKEYWDITEHTWGYHVTYRIGDATGNVRMDYDPGDRIPLRDGQLLPNDRHSI